MGLFDSFKRKAERQQYVENNLKAECNELLKTIRDRILKEPVLFAVPVDSADQYENNKNICKSINVESIEGVYCNSYKTNYYEGGQIILFWPNSDFAKDPIAYEIAVFDVDISGYAYVLLQDITTSELLLQKVIGSWMHGIMLPVGREEADEALDRLMGSLEFEANAAQTYYEISERNRVVNLLKLYAGRHRIPIQISKEDITKAEETYNKVTGNGRKQHWQAVESSILEYNQVVETYPDIKTTQKGHRNNEVCQHFNSEETERLSSELICKWMNPETKRLEPVIPCIHADLTVSFEGSSSDDYSLTLPNGKVICEKNVNRVVLYRNRDNHFVIEGTFPAFASLEERFLVNYEDLDSFLIVIFSKKKYEDRWALYQANVYYQGEKIDSFKNVTNLGVYDIGQYWAESINGLKLACGYTIYDRNVVQSYSAPGACKVDELEEMRRRQNQIHKLELVEKDYIKIPFFFDGSKATAACYQYCKEHADVFEETDSLIPEDDTINYTCWFQKERYKELAFIRYLGNISHGLLGNGYFGRNASTLTNYFSRQDPYAKAVTTTDTDRDTIQSLYKICGEPFNIEEFPESLKNSINQIDVLRTLNYLLEGKEEYTPSEFKKLYEEYYDKAVKAGITQRKWFNEYKLFETVSKQYSDAVFQYRSEWLDRQSLDIYIPSLKIGIEYQGQQHYKAVDFFGGEESFNAQIERDKRKREKCETNKVGLIYWRYETPITKGNVAKAIERCKTDRFIET